MKPSAPPPQFKEQSALRRLFTTDHRTLGRRYLALSLAAVVAGTLMSLVMRIHLVWPDRIFPLFGPIQPEDYLALVTLHGTLMLFFVLTLAPQGGFGSLLIPAQIGARRMAFPALNALAFWLFLLAFLTLLSSSFVQGGAAISGWTAYPPLSAVASAGPGQGLGMDLWLTSIGLFSLASILSGVNQLATIVAFRCPGMTWQRLPLTVWSWFTAALLTIIAFSVLLAALLLLASDRHAHTSFFLPAGDLVNATLHTTGNGSPLLWLHLFWFFGHPEVYIAILPGMGLTSMLLANFSRRRVFGYHLMILTTLLIGFLGILVWGHHMFVAGLNPFAGTAFSISTMAIALPAAAKVLSWLATIWRSRPSYTTPGAPSQTVFPFEVGSTGPRHSETISPGAPSQSAPSIEVGFTGPRRSETISPGAPSQSAPSIEVGSTGPRRSETISPGAPSQTVFPFEVGSHCSSRPTPMLFALGFVSLFIAGGLTGPILAQPILDQYLHNTYFVVAHFHLIMAMAGVFGLFAATYYWFPRICGRMMNETLGRWHFWITIIAAYATFLPMHLAGLGGNPRHYAQLIGIPNAAGDLLAKVIPVQTFISISAIVLASAQLLFLVNLAHSLRRGRLAPENPWQATTLEWSAPFDAQNASDQQIHVQSGPCEYEPFRPQWAAHAKPE